MKFFKRNKPELKKPVFRAVRDCLYSAGGQHVLRLFKAGEKLPLDWETGHEGFKHFRAEDNIMSRERKLKEKEAKLHA
ncbi:hypothetical protein ES705_24349 [subsurface metagenome]